MQKDRDNRAFSWLPASGSHCYRRKIILKNSQGSVLFFQEILQFGSGDLHVPGLKPVSNRVQTSLAVQALEYLLGERGNPELPASRQAQEKFLRIGTAVIRIENAFLTEFKKSCHRRLMCKPAASLS